MSLRSLEISLGRPRCRQWTPLLSQQLRLRHLYQIFAYNINSQDGSFYYTLHLTTMCAPFFTSEKIDSPHPKWADMDVNSIQYSSSSTFVLRIWKHKDNQEDTIILTWGIALSGLIFLGTKLSEIQPVSFNDNSVVFYMRGGYFTCLKCIRNDTPKPLPFIDSLNVSSNGEYIKIYRNIDVKCSKSDVRSSCNIEKLQRLHSLQTSIKNKSLDAQAMRDKINSRCGLIDADIETIHSPVHRHAASPHLLSMTSLNKMLHQQDKPTRVQRQEIIKIRKLIESARFRTKLLAQERDRKLANIRQLNIKCSTLADNNEDNEIRLMDQYRQLNRDFDKLKDGRKDYFHAKDLYFHTANQLANRRKQLNAQLLQIYPIHRVTEKKFTISGIYLPDSDTLLESTERGLSVALGYVTHAALMCASFLQVPLRYPVTHYGSRSTIVDHISSSIPDREREFPLYISKDRLQFNYAVYLLNKNISQLRWYCGQATSDLRATLPNLLSLLQGRSIDQRCDIGVGLSYPPMNCQLFETHLMTGADSKPFPAASSKYSRLGGGSDSVANVSHNFGAHFAPSAAAAADPILDSIRQESSLESIRKVASSAAASSCSNNATTPTKRNRRKSPESGGRGLSEILAMPEMLINRQISPGDLKKYVASERHKNGTPFSSPAHSTRANVQPEFSCDISTKDRVRLDTSIEQGTDTLDACLNLATPLPDTGGGAASKTATNGDSSYSSDANYFSFVNKIKESRASSDTDDKAPSSAAAAAAAAAAAVLRTKNTASGGADSGTKSRRRISRSVGSYTDDDNDNNMADLRQNFEIGSDPLLNISACDGSTAAGRAFDAASLANDSLEAAQKDFLQKWLDSGPALVCSEENLYPDEFLGTTVSHGGGATSDNVETATATTPLTLRANALVQRTSFNLVKPK